MKRFSFQQNHVPGFIERMLDFFLIPNTLQEQESFIKTDALASFFTDHSPKCFSLELKDVPNRGKDFLKFSNSFTSNAEMKNQIFETLRMIDQDEVTNKHLRWQYLATNLVNEYKS